MLNITRSECVCALPSRYSSFISRPLSTPVTMAARSWIQTAALWVETFLQVVGDDRHCVRETRCGRARCDTRAAAMSAAAAATHASPESSSHVWRRLGWKICREADPDLKGIKTRKNIKIFKSSAVKAVCQEKPQNFDSSCPAFQSLLMPCGITYADVVGTCIHQNFINDCKC